VPAIPLCCRGDRSSALVSLRRSKPQGQRRASQGGGCHAASRSMKIRYCTARARGCLAAAISPSHGASSPPGYRRSRRPTTDNRSAHVPADDTSPTCYFRPASSPCLVYIRLASHGGETGFRIAHGVIRECVCGQLGLHAPQAPEHPLGATSVRYSTRVPHRRAGRQQRDDGTIRPFVPVGRRSSRQQRHEDGSPSYATLVLRRP
jgi:hypothetical protein